MPGWGRHSLPEMLLAQQISAHEYSITSYSLQRMSAFDLQRIEISFVLDFLLSYSLAATVLGTPMKHVVVENYALVFDLVVLHLHMRNSYGSLVMVCNEFAS